MPPRGDASGGGHPGAPRPESDPDLATPPPRVGWRLLFAGPRGRCFLTDVHWAEPHRPERMSAVMSRLRPGDQTIWIGNWHADRSYLESVARRALAIGVAPSSLWLLGNTAEETREARSLGLEASFVNGACWIDEARFPAADPAGPRPWRAVLVAQLVAYKRPWLARRVRGLALVETRAFRDEDRVAFEAEEEPRLHERDVPWQRVAAILRASRAGLALSAVEGFCGASAEYLLSGLPVVSTASAGGRDVYYDAINSLVVDDDPEAVARGVDAVLARRPDPAAIRAAHRSRVEVFRRRFREEVLAPILRRLGSPDGAEAVFRRIHRPAMMEWPTLAEALAITTGDARP